MLYSFLWNISNAAILSIYICIYFHTKIVHLHFCFFLSSFLLFYSKLNKQQKSFTDLVIDTIKHHFSWSFLFSTSNRRWYPVSQNVILFFIHVYLWLHLIPVWLPMHSSIQIVYLHTRVIDNQSTMVCAFASHHFFYVLSNN